MELPQPRPFKTQEFRTGRKPTHDFLSLCSHSTVHPDPKPTPPPSSQGSHLKTHDFLQPLECVGAKEDVSRINSTTTASEKPPPPAPPPPLQHVLPGGIGTYTISPIPYFHHHHQRIPKPELSPPMMFNANERNVLDENSNSNCSSYAAASSGFTLWDESASGKKGQTRKENSVGERVNMRATVGQWPVAERRSQSLTNNHMSGFSSLSSSQGSVLKSQSFMDMIRSAKGSSQEDDLDDEEDFIMKKESSSTSQSHRVDLRVKADVRGSPNDQKLNTPRSKHSATEQRRRSKINDRFQMLRQLIPNSDQKRDKASFLLEVIEYIQFLQEKADKYVTSYQGWNHEPAKLLNWQSNNNQQLVPEGVAFAPKLEEEKNNIPVSVLATAQGVVIDHPTTATTSPFPLSIQSNSFFSPVIAGNPVPQFHARVASSEAVEPSPSSRSQKEEEDEEVLEGNIRISSVYSQGLVKTLREALENSGVDLTKASISVEIELAKQSSSSSFKDHEVREPVSRTRNDNVKQTRKPKRLKTGQ
ncbi:basic helix-loop-helix (bHLH) DNA-binding superfamily protein [Arabidopsis thaliana]|uniref:Basic helix-loop-helix (BHLH) DNA-binding superfamily protein n=1 Tax=Arabidopsis thaliana TaxID=3702 RepID=F4K9L2_ARATH|nr:basic helix-loop-helix (bHLH) DNA-binding superfamily protein [Arabidopsis thaliana]AED91254.1 basic helix-loop-helix (bHLH) DNA-binding superfamily protein [Arabidopsis thaliana]|eukprot:NP_001190258.1 basic helix-loop-helix (bHLH) DNA-binding superfamily protein [Arabidopsis thaliana]